MKNKERDITFHYTDEKMVIDLINLLPLHKSTVALDAGSGKNKVWFKNLPCLIKYECELEDGCDYMDWQQTVDWVVGNPPFHMGWDFVKKTLDIAQVGFAFLGNINFFNQFTPRRLEILNSKGFYLQKIHIVSDKRWFGRYYFLIFSKEKNNFLTSSKNVYGK